MVWTASFNNGSRDIFLGVEGYFATDGIVEGGPVNGAAPVRPVVSRGPAGEVVFTSPIALGRAVFSGPGLTVQNVQLASGAIIPILTGGTITRIDFDFNYLLYETINTLGPNAPNIELLRDPARLDLAENQSAAFALPNVSAAAMGAAILQSYQTNSLTPLRNFLSSDSQNWTGNANANILVGFGGNDFIDGRAGNDAIDGGPGNDTLVGGPGVDLLVGGPGSDLFLPGPSGQGPVGDSVSDNGTAPGEIDTVSYANATAGVTIDLDFADGNQSAGEAAGVSIEASIEVIEGSPFNDIIVGKNTVVLANDTLLGGAGNDLLLGMAGSDVLQGGPGNDSLDGGTNLDQLGNVGQGDIAVFAASSAQILRFAGANGTTLIAAPGGGVDALLNIELIGLTDGVFALQQVPLSNGQAVFGDGNANTLNGTGGRDALAGEGGNDTLNGGGGNDILEGGDGNDRIDGGAGADAMAGGAGGDTFFVDNTGDTVAEFSQGGGTDRVVTDVNFALGAAHVEELVLRAGTGLRGTGNDLDNLVLGGAGADTINSGDGRDTVRGGAGNDAITGFASGADGRDILSGEAGADTLAGGPGNDALYGDAFAPALGLGVEARQVYRLYQATLGRAPDTAGHAGWTAALIEKQTDLGTVAGGFVGSQEFQNTYGALDNRGFVTLLYQNVLGRAPSGAEVTGWLNAMTQGTSRAGVVVGFSESQEFQNNTNAAAQSFAEARTPMVWADDVFRLYQATLGRTPDAAGFLGWADNLGNGGSFRQVTAGFVQSAEFQATYGALSNGGFVDLLYQNVLGRSADAAGRAAWVAQLQGGTTREAVVEGFAQSQEFIAGTAAGLKTWVRSQGWHDNLNGGTGTNVLSGGILADQFVFDKGHASTNFIVDLEVWDEMRFVNFGYRSDAEVLSHMTQVGADVVFSDQGLTVTIEDFTLSRIAADMIAF